MDFEFESQPSRKSNVIMSVGLLFAILATTAMLFTRTLSAFVPASVVTVLVVGGDFLSVCLAFFGYQKAREDQWLTLPKWHLAAYFVVWFLQPMSAVFMEAA